MVIIPWLLDAQPAASAQADSFPPLEDPDKRLLTALSSAEELVVSYKNDDAILILNGILDNIEAQGRFDSPLGLRAQMVMARAFEHDDRDTTALRMLLRIKEKCKEKGVWDVYFQASLTAALLFENSGRKENCRVNLMDAQSALEQNGLDSLYPLLTIQLASFYRVLEPNRDSAFFYARETLRTAPGYNLPLTEAWGHMMMAMLFFDNDDEKTLWHYRRAYPLFVKIGDFTGLSYLMRGISSKYFQMGEYGKALAANDTTILFTQESISLGYERNSTLYSAYKKRAEIYHALGKPDSAWHYITKGYDLEIKHLGEWEQDKVVNIIEQYENEKKQLQLNEQSIVIRKERERRYLLIGGLFIVLLFALALAWFYGKLRKANQNTRQLAENLKSLDTAKSRFFANVSHELRTPLTLINGPIQNLLQNRDRPEQDQQLLEVAGRSGKQLELLINEILDLEKLAVGMLSLNLKQTDLRAFFISYIAQFESQAASKGITYTYTINMEDGLSAAIDRDKCRQILFNLLSNAIKFTDRSGKVEVRLTFDAGQLVLQVEDTGQGIPPEDLPYIFDRFFQSSKPRGPAQGGTGIGLAICKEYAQLMGGKVEVESRLNEGSLFTVSIPVQPVQSTITKKQPVDLEAELEDYSAIAAFPMAGRPATNASDSGKPHVLVVEDNHDLQAYLRLTLSDHYQITLAQHGKEALDILAGSNDFQLILSDLMMPVMDGHQLLEQLKAQDRTRHIPVIILTARADFKSKLKSLRLGVDDYLLKPFNDTELITRIDNLLRHQAIRRQAVLEDKEEEQDSGISAADQEWLSAFEAYVQANLDSGILSIQLMADEFHMSRSTLLRQLKRLTGLSPKQYLLEARLNAARQLLETRTYRSIERVADAIGYSDVRPFSRLFKKRFGKLPSEF